MPFFAAPTFFQILFWLFAAVTLVQLAAWWFLFGKLAFRKSPPNTPIPQYPNIPISIIICARNEAKNLRRFLPSILTQQFENEWELLVVDDASEDETPTVLQFFQEQNPDRLRVICIPEKKFPGKKHALALGMAAAKHDLILLTDADCKPASPHWLARMAATLSANPETEIVLGYGPSTPRSTGLGWGRYETAYTATQYFSFALAGMPYMGVGRNLAFRRQVFDRVGGFRGHAHLASGDDDLFVNAAANAKNTAICLDPASFVYSDAPPNLHAWLRQKRRHLSAGSAYRWPHQLALAMLAGSQVGHYFLFLVLLLASFAPKIVGAIFLLRLFSVGFVFGKILHVLSEPGLFFKIPMFDVLLSAYFGAIVPWFLLNKKAQVWK